MGFQRAFRLGLLPLRTLGAVAWHRLGMGARQRVGTGLGHLAREPWPHRLGTAPSGNARLAWAHVEFLSGGHFRNRPIMVLICQLPTFRKQHPAILPAGDSKHPILPQQQERHSLHSQLGSCLRRWPRLPERLRPDRQAFPHSPPSREPEPRFRPRWPPPRLPFQW